MRQRYHNAMGSGELTDPSGAEPKARVTYTAMYYDEVGRSIAQADYGTNGDSALARPATVPARSDDVLITSTEYDEAGMASRTVDPAGREHRQFFDALGRTVKTVENYVDGLVDGAYPDEDVTVETTYTPDGQLSTLTAKNPATGDQVTRYVYGTTLADSAVARRDLLRAKFYPDSDDTPDPLAHGADVVYDRVEYRYNRQGEVAQKKDQNETVHAYAYDRLGRRIHDRVTAVGSGVDPAVRRISTTYEIRGMVEKLTSYDSPTVGAGSVVNEVAFAYDDTGRLVREYQEHAGAKDAATLSVGYAYDPSADAGQFTKGLRPTSLRYPNGRLVHFTYGPPDGTNDALDRLAAIHDDDAGCPGQRLAEYTYLGLGTIVVEDYPQPQVKLDYTGEGSYRGFDRFGRIVDERWIAYGNVPEVLLDRYTYQYDRAGNRTRRTNELNHAFDETYGYDRINRLVAAARADGFAQSWTLDALGNFPRFDDDGNLQSRTANPVNEITAITAGWITPSYDAAGNLTSGPLPGNETLRAHYVYDAWNRLVKMYADDSQNPGASGDLVAQYVYEGTNRRIEKEVTEAGGGPRHVHYYYNHDWQLLEERFVDGQGVTIASNQYVWSARYIDAPIVRFHDGNGDGDLLDTEDSIRHYTGDGNLNATATIDAATGGVVERYVYTAYGEATAYDQNWSSTAAPTTDGPLYCGYFFDAETALCHVRHRYYDHSLASFIGRDPIGYRSGVNLCGYAHQSPTMHTDPWGLEQWPAPGYPPPDPPTVDLSEIEFPSDDGIGLPSCPFAPITPIPRPEPPPWVPPEKTRCENAARAFQGRVLTGYRNKRYRVTITCKPTCGPKDGSAAQPTPGNIQICINYHVSDPNLVIQHEMVHAQQYCDCPRLVTDCTTTLSYCVTWEREAYRRSCEIARRRGYLPPGTSVDRCIKCGVYLSCRHHGTVSEPRPPCRPGETGVRRNRPTPPPSPPTAPPFPLD